ncbi:MAG: HEAT repeat domain-containing protein [Ignavibacteriaceae bacterium]|jgi:HEAT repeat protein
MKLEVLSRTKLVIASLSLLFVVTIGELTAQTNSISDITNYKYALKNLLENIKSDNDGVKRSSIYFIGYYRITEAEEALIEQLEKERNPSNRILIALVLYELGSEDGLLEVKKLASNDDNQKVRRLSTHIYNEYLIKDSKGKLYLVN